MATNPPDNNLAWVDDKLKRLRQLDAHGTVTIYYKKGGEVSGLTAEYDMPLGDVALGAFLQSVSGSMAQDGNIDVVVPLSGQDAPVSVKIRAYSSPPKK